MSFSPLVVAAVLSVASAAVAQAGNPFAPPPAAGGGNPFAPPAAANAAPPASPASNAPVVMRMQTLTDPGMKNMPSHTLLVPDGWKATGGAWWPPRGLFKILPSQNVTIAAPDGRLIRVAPSMSFSDPRPSPQAMQQMNMQRPAEGTLDGGYPVIYFPERMEAWPAFVEKQWIRFEFPAATDITVDPVVHVPEVERAMQPQLAQFQQMDAQTNQTGARLGMSTRTDMACLATTAHYTLDGQRFDHMYLWGLMWGTQQNPGFGQISWTIEPNVSMRVHAGQMDAEMPLLMSVFQSLRQTPEWQEMYADHVAKLNGIQAKGAADRANLIADASRYAAEGREKARIAQGKAQDKAHGDFMDYLGGVANYKPHGGGPPVKLPSGYQHVYCNERGEYLLSNDGNYDPNHDDQRNGTSWGMMEGG